MRLKLSSSSNYLEIGAACKLLPNSTVKSENSSMSEETFLKNSRLYRFCSVSSTE
jgi:hypothetical protein